MTNDRTVVSKRNALGTIANLVVSVRVAYQQLAVKPHASQAPTVAVGRIDMTAATAKFGPRVKSIPKAISAASASTDVVRNYVPNEAYRTSLKTLGISSKAKFPNSSIRKMTPPPAPSTFKGSIARSLPTVSVASSAIDVENDVKEKSQQQNITKQEPADEAMRSTGAVEAVQVEIEVKEETSSWTNNRHHPQQIMTHTRKRRLMTHR